MTPRYDEVFNDKYAAIFNLYSFSSLFFFKDINFFIKMIHHIGNKISGNTIKYVIEIYLMTRITLANWYTKDFLKSLGIKCFWFIIRF